MSRSVLLFFMVGLTWFQGDWEFKMDKDGVKVYTRIEDESSIKSFKGITNVNATALEVLELIRDIDRYPNWIEGVSSANVIKRVSENDYYIHVKIKLPFPVSNRDVVQHIRIQKQSDTHFFIDILTSNNLLEEEKGYVRMPLSDGHWNIKQETDDITEIEMVSQNDPGGSVPKWIVNMLVTDSPYKTLKNMHDVLVR